jgi:hypothetical protein
MENIKTTYSEILKHYERNIKKQNVKKKRYVFETSSIYSRDIGILIDDCLKVFDSFKLLR